MGIAFFAFESQTSFSSRVIASETGESILIPYAVLADARIIFSNWGM